MLRVGRILSNSIKDSRFLSDLADDNISTAAKGMYGNYLNGNAAGSVHNILRRSTDMASAEKALMRREQGLDERIGKMDGKQTPKRSALVAEQNHISNALANIRSGGAGNFSDVRKAEMSVLKQARDDADDLAMSKAKEMPGLLKDYYTGNGDLGVASKRIGATAAVYGGAAVGSRYVSGGGVTYNNQGQRDIAGIPFI